MMDPTAPEAYYADWNGRIVRTSEERTVVISPVEWAALLAEAWEKGHDSCCSVYARHCSSAENPYGATP